MVKEGLHVKHRRNVQPEMTCAVHIESSIGMLSGVQI